MATRNLTNKFENLRSQLRGNTGKRGRSGVSDGDGDGSLLSGSNPASDIENGRDLGITSEMPPEWVDINDTIHKDTTKIKESLKTLQKLHAARLKVSFGDEVIAEQERDIEILTQEITRLLRKSENNVKKIAVVGNTGKLSPQEKAVRLNVMRALATDLQGQSKIFRNSQKDFLKNLRDQEQSGSQYFDDSSDSKQVLNDEDALDRGFSPEQQQALAQMNERATEREKEIIRIAQSINELASLFRELNVLVIEQGTILDRIDYNIEQTKTKVGMGVVELEKADDYSKKAYTIKCMIVLIIVAVILIILLIWKKSS